MFASSRGHEIFTSDPNLKFVRLIDKLGTNFRFKRVTSKYIILVWFMDLKLTPPCVSLMW